MINVDSEKLTPAKINDMLDALSGAIDMGPDLFGPIPSWWPEEFQEILEERGFAYDPPLQNAQQLSDEQLQRFNPNHDELGKFAEAEGGSAAGERQDIKRKTIRGDANWWGASHGASYQIAGVAAKMMGVEGWKSENYLEDKVANKIAMKFVSSISQDKEGSGEPLFHGFENRKGIDWKVGDTITLPLAAACGDEEDSAGYGMRLDPKDNEGPPTVFAFPVGTPFAPFAKWSKADAAEFGHHWSEAIVGGKYVIDKLSSGTARDWRHTPYTIVHLHCTETFNPETKAWEKR